MKSLRTPRLGVFRMLWPCTLLSAGVGPTLLLVCVRVYSAAYEAQPVHADGPRVDAHALDAKIRSLLDTHGAGIKASVWVGGPTGPAWYTWQPDEVRPTASAVKTALLVEFFARYASRLDQPPPGLDDVLGEGSPAFRHYSAAKRKEVRQALAGMSVRKLGRVMMGSDPANVDVYNGAANVVIALLGGPEESTKAIRAGPCVCLDCRAPLHARAPERHRRQRSNRRRARRGTPAPGVVASARRRREDDH